MLNVCGSEQALLRPAIAHTEIMLKSAGFAILKKELYQL